MNILVFNCGSSSLKFKLLSLPGEEELAGGEAQRVGPKTAEPSKLLFHRHGKKETLQVDMPDHKTAFQEVMKLLGDDKRLMPDAMGHRMVHGGAIFDDHARVDDAVFEKLERVEHLAPIHNPPATALLNICRGLYPEIPQAVVFDTAFHATIPPHAYTYAIPKDIRDGLGIRKYGFHGTSHQFVVGEAARMLGIPLEKFSAVSCHLGSGGASLCAVVGGRSIDNTMGFSPLQGLIMSTRSGDLDPAVTLNLLTRFNGNAGAVSKMLNTKSGVLGLSGASADIRDILKQTRDGARAADRPAMTRQVYLWRIRKYLGAYLAVVGRADAIIFTDTIGETVPEVRWAVCSGMETFGLKIDPKRNDTTELPVDVAAADSPVRILAVATNEELAIARQTYRMFQAN